MFDCPSGQNIQMRCDGSWFSIMEVEDEHNYIAAAFGLPYRFGQPETFFPVHP
jgi:hypothetical protein